MVGKNVAGPLFGFLTLILCFVSIACLLLKSWIAFWIFLVLFIVALAVFAILCYKEFVDFFASRQLRYGTNVTLSILGVLGIAIFVNIIVVQRFDIRADLTKLRDNSLSEATKKILKNLDKEVDAIAFFSDETLPKAIQALDKLKLYQRETELISVSVKNPYIDTRLVDTNLLDGTIVFQTKERQEKVTVVNEQKYTSAILKLIQSRSKNVYFLEGHGERGIDDLTNAGCGFLKNELENQNFKPSSFSFLTEANIPHDCDLLVIPGPTTAFTLKEISVIDKYLNNNGKLLVLFNPSTVAEDVNKELVKLMKKWGVTVGNDLVFDMILHDAYRGTIAPVPIYEPHDITRQLGNLRLAFPNTRSVTPIKNRKSKLIVKILAKTASPIAVSWGETERKPDGQFSGNGYTPDVDIPAPVSIAVAVERLIDADTENNPIRSPTRIVVYGSSEFAMNFYFRKANRDILLTTVNWLTDDGDLIAITEPDRSTQVLRSMTIQEARLVQIISLFLIPLSVFFAGLVVWWQRRVGG